MAMSRSENMARIKSKDTQPELVVRRAIHAMGYRFRLHSGKLPGKPDLVFPSRRKVIFVHGCFWHQHAHCMEGRVPKSRQDYWIPKLAKTKSRDSENISAIEALGWKCLVIWECNVEEARFADVIRAFLDSPL
jgi:DNA mismatch endonuclease (patch repair protein)